MTTGQSDAQRITALEAAVKQQRQMLHTLTTAVLTGVVSLGDYSREELKRGIEMVDGRSLADDWTPPTNYDAP